MINKQDNPVEWTLLMYELEETKEHISKLIEDWYSPEDFDEIDFKVQIAHIYTDLNRIYHSRDRVGKISDKEFVRHSRFPVDIEPI
ncbi:MAG: hypothetical protein ACFCU5_19195 [Pleurocapsa sp.]